MTDLVLAILHHALAFSIAALIAVELAIVRPGLQAGDLPLLSRLDTAYGICAAALVVVGIGRVHDGLKGWEFYVYNPIFWAKMAAFAAVGLLSVRPTVRIIRWRRTFAEAAAVVPDTEIRRVRAFLKAQAAVFALIFVFAAMMARGYGL